MFDAEQKVVVSNARYGDIYHLEPRSDKAGHLVARRSSNIAARRAPISPALRLNVYLKRNVQADEAKFRSSQTGGWLRLPVTRWRMAAG